MSLFDDLVAALGASSVLTEAADKLPYETELRGLYRGHALVVVKPRSTEEVAQVMRLAAKHRVAVVPQSGNTGLTGGGVPFESIVIALDRMGAVREFDAANASITVEAGVVLAEVQRLADEAGFLFPLSLGAEGSCRIGGNVSSNAGGTAVLHYGSMRDLVLGLEVVLADGRVWNGLKSLRKDNAGYDLKHLFIGSEGTLGIVTAATLKLFPKPLSRSVAFMAAQDPHAVLRVFERMRAEAGPFLTGFEIIPRFGLDIVLKHVPGTQRPLSGDYPWFALVELSSTQADADLGERMETLLGAAMEAGDCLDATIASSEAQGTALWHIRESLSGAQRPEGGSIKHDVSVPVSRVADFIVEATALCEAAMPGLRVCAFGHIGDGNIHFNLSQPVGMDKQAFLGRWEDFNRIVHDKIVAMNGSIAAEHGIGLIKRDELAHYKDAVTLDLMRAVKTALDPENRLNPGKVIAIGNDMPPAVPGKI